MEANKFVLFRSLFFNALKEDGIQIKNNKNNLETVLVLSFKYNNKYKYIYSDYYNYKNNVDAFKIDALKVIKDKYKDCYEV